MKNLVLFLLFCAMPFAKGQGQLMHFTRSMNLSSLFLPGSKYDSHAFQVLIPDSVYSDAQIYIKKASLNNKGKFYVNFYVDSTKTHAETFFSCKGSKNEVLLRRYFAENLQMDQIKTESGRFCSLYQGRQLELIIEKIGRKTTFKIYLSECKPMDQ